ncbi:MAG: VOC family protein [Pseudomonadota bacterium]
MQVNALVPMLTFVDIGEAIAFYKSIGFRLEGTDEPHYGQGHINWAMMKFGNASLMLSINGRDGDKSDQHFFLNVDDADAFYAQIVDKVTILHELKDQFYGTRDFWFKDPFGYHWGAGHTLEVGRGE